MTTAGTDSTPLRGGATHRRLLAVGVCTATLLLVAAAAGTAATGRPAVTVATVSPAGSHAEAERAPDGYWLVAADGGVFAYGNAGFYGSAGGLDLNRPVVGMAATPDGRGYWLVAADGGVFAYGDAEFHGSAGGLDLNRPVVGMAATPDGRGYWLVAADGGVFAYGDAEFHGSAGGLDLNRPVVGMAATPDGRGYWLVAADGGVFAYGDAPFDGRAGPPSPVRPVRAIAGTPSGGGYWLVAADGGVSAFGTAGRFGSAVGLTGTGTVVDLRPTTDGAGYWMSDSIGGVFAFGDAAFSGSAAGIHLAAPVVGMAAAATTPVPTGFTLGGDAVGVLLPGTESVVDLRITDTGAGPVTVVSATTTVTTSTGACRASDFTVVRGLGVPVTVPAGATVTLSQLGIPTAEWPAIAMVDTGADQDACKGAALTLHFRGEAVG